MRRRNGRSKVLYAIKRHDPHLCRSGNQERTPARIQTSAFDMPQHSTGLARHEVDSVIDKFGSMLIIIIVSIVVVVVERLKHSIHPSMYRKVVMLCTLIMRQIGDNFVIRHLFL